MITYGSGCSGIESASLAWEPLGWQAQWFAEIEPFPSAVLAHHWPEVPNLGDMTQLHKKVLWERVPAPDVLIAGTPCQAFSVAGLRKGLEDDRGQLTLSYVRLADANDFIRRKRGLPPSVITWENVPGVLSSKDNAFGCFLAGLAGEYDELEPGPRPEHGRKSKFWNWDKKANCHVPKWPYSGAVIGPQRTVAWRTIDAQYFGVAQRRRRVFLIASARNGFNPAAVLFESEGVRRDIAPCREQKQGVTRGIEIGPAGGRYTELNPTLDTRAKDGPIRNQLADAVLEPKAYGGGRCGSSIDVAATLVAKGQNCDFEVESFIVHGTQDPIVSKHTAHALGRNNGQENVIAFSAKDYGGDATVNLSPTLRAGGHNQSHANSGNWMAVAFAENSRNEVRLQNGDGQIVGALSTDGGKPGQGTPAIAFNPVQEGMGLTDIATPIGASDGGGNQGAVFVNSRVRRLTPIECERLQDMPDNHTQIPWRGKPAAQCPDGPRYKAIGNSKAVSCVRWLGIRIENELNKLEG